MSDGYQQVGVATQPVTGTVAVSNIPASQPVTDAAAAASLATIAANTTGPLAVTGTFYQATQPVSAASLPLPAGAATDATAQGILSALNDLAFTAIIQAEEAMFA